MIIGYARVSTDDQKLDLQKDALIKAGCEKIFEDHGFSGIQKDRPGLNEAISCLKEGDVLVVWKLDRLGRGLADLVLTLDDFGSKGIHFKAIADGIDTTTPTGHFLFGLLAVLAHEERKTIIKRTKAGLEAARRRGIKLGRPKKINAERYEVVQQLLKDGKKTVPEIAHILKVTRQTVYNAMKQQA